jgi:S-methylmethionine-dependent homocysteine/selenocysteine methylase
MAKYRNQLPQLNGKTFLTDGGLETTLIFHQGMELPYFAAFDLVNDAQGRETLKNYFTPYIDIVKTKKTGFILESPTWRASSDWAQKLGYDADTLATTIHQAMELLAQIRDEHEDADTLMVISGCIGPRGDGYNPDDFMTANEAETYHTTQINTLSNTEADMITALTMTYVEEAIGIVRAAQTAGMPVAISFTVETDGRLPSGQPLREAIEQVDTATNKGPAYYMVNCAHPTHFAHTFKGDDAWLQRIQGIRANASACSHAELDEAKELDDGNPLELGTQYKQLKSQLTQLNILGGCCGTDHRHVAAICQACT